MEIEIHRYDSQKVDEFADAHGLKMVVRERGPNHHPNARFYASFEGIEVKSGCILSGPFGNGATPEDAIANYLPKISKQVLVHNACRPDRRVFNAPVLVGRNTRYMLLEYWLKRMGNLCRQRLNFLLV